MWSDSSWVVQSSSMLPVKRGRGRGERGGAGEGPAQGGAEVEARARAEEVERFLALILEENDAAIELFRALSADDPEPRRSASGHIELKIELPEGGSVSGTMLGRALRTAARGGVEINASGFGGNNDTYGGEGVVTGVHDNVSLSAGGFYYNTDGWRNNNDLEQHIANFYGQAALTPDLNAQVELRRRKSDEGFLPFNFDKNDFIRDYTVNRDQDTARVGLRC